MTIKAQYQGSPREAANNRMRAQVAELGQQWAQAFDQALVTRGRRIGCLKSKPPSGALNDGRAAVMWHARNDAVCEINAGKYGFFPNRSYGGTIMALMWCRDPDAKRAYDIALSAYYNEAKKAATEKETEQ